MAIRFINPDEEFEIKVNIEKLKTFEINTLSEVKEFNVERKRLLSQITSLGQDVAAGRAL